MTTPTQDAAAIRRLLEDRRRALHARDAEALTAQHAADLQVYDLAPPLRSHGAATEAAKLRAWFATWQGPIDYDLLDVRIEVGDTVAFSTGLARLRGTKLDGSTPDLWTRNTIGYRRTPDGWRIAHLHESVPFHMDGSDRAALDLQP